MQIYHAYAHDALSHAVWFSIRSCATPLATSRKGTLTLYQVLNIVAAETTTQLVGVSLFYESFFAIVPGAQLNVRPTPYLHTWYVGRGSWEVYCLYTATYSASQAIAADAIGADGNA